MQPPNQEPHSDPTDTMRDETPPPEEATSATKKSQVRPWVRFFARNLDFVIFGALLSLFLQPIFGSHHFIAIITSIFLYMCIEIVLLATWGYTPGKWLLHVKVRDQSGKLLTYQAAAMRAFRVWVFGIAFGIPLIIYVANYIAYRRLTQKGITSWDQEGQISVTHSEIELYRKLIAIAIAAIVTIVAIVIPTIRAVKMYDELKTEVYSEIEKQALQEQSVKPSQLAPCDPSTSQCWTYFIYDNDKKAFIGHQGGYKTLDQCRFLAQSLIKTANSQNLDYICGFNCVGKKCEKTSK